MYSKNIFTTAIFSIFLFLQGCSEPEVAAISTPPDSVRENNTEVMFDREINDPYRWLEILESEKTPEWARAQDAYAREILEADQETLDQIKEGVAQHAMADTMGLPLRRGEWLYSLLASSGFVNPGLVRKNIETGKTETLVDPGPDRVVRDFHPNLQGNILAYALQHKGTRERAWFFMDLGSGESRPVSIPGASINGNPWLEDAGEFVFYKSRNREENTPGRIFSINTDSTDQPNLLFESTERPEARIFPDLTDDGRFLVITLFENSNANRVFVKDLTNPGADPWELFEDQQAYHTYIGNDDSTLFFLTSYQSPNGRLVELEINEQAPLTPATVVPEQETALTQAYYFEDHFLGVYMENGFQTISIIDADGKTKATIAPPKGLLWTDYPVNWPPISGGAHGKAYFSSIALIGAGIYEIDLAEGSMTQIFSRGEKISADSYVTEQVFYPSHDGAMVPMTIIRKSGLDISQSPPLLMNVYGAYGFTFIPFFNPMYRHFLDAGGVYAVPNIRGGGIYGQEWYENGRGDNKINAVHDTVFAAKWLLDNGYSIPERFAVTGNSAGTVPAAAAAINNPELFGALLLEVPLSDMIRYRLWTQSWNSEFGTTDSPEALAASLSVSPYHLIQNAEALPPTMITAGDQDRIAHPSHAYKLTAALQHAQKSGFIPLLHIDWGTGHGGQKTTQQRVDTWAYELVFLYQTLGIEEE